jgi:glycosyltransferase involved in cell wall biosynthesis
MGIWTPNEKREPVIVACIPAYNEEKTIARIILQVQKHVDAVVVCDDGSSDMTSEIARRLGAVVLRNEENRGYGAALQCLFRKAKDLDADIVLTLDADGQHDPMEIPAMITPILEDKAEIVLGSRFLNGERDVPRLRGLGIKILTRASNGSIKAKISDAQSGFRAYNKNAIQQLRLFEDGMGISAEILMRAGDQGLRVVEVPVRVTYKGDTSTDDPVSHGLSVLSTIIRLVVEERPLFYLGIPGALLTLVGAAFGLILWIKTIQFYYVEQSIVVSLTLGALSFMVIGVFTLSTAITLYAVLRLTQKQRL